MGMGLVLKEHALGFLVQVVGPFAKGGGLGGGIPEGIHAMILRRGERGGKTNAGVLARTSASQIRLGHDGESV